MAFKKANKAIIATAAMSMIIGSLGINTGTNIVNANETNRPNVILMVGDGMSTSATTFARWYKDAQDGVYGNDKLHMDDYLRGYIKTTWANGPITDSAPAATAMATGQKTNDKYLGVDVNGNPLATVLEAAELEGMATGLIATSEMTHATPAGFSAHVADRGNYNAVVQQQMKSGVDVVLGGGIGAVSKYFDTQNDSQAQEKYNQYVNDLKAALTNEGYEIATTREELENSKGDKVWGIFAEADLAYDMDRQVNDAYKDEPTLAEMTKNAIERLNKNEEGFFLMVEGSKIDWAAHDNDPAGIASDILSYDEAVKEAIEFAKEDGNTIVISTSDHGNSGIIYGNQDTTLTYDSQTFDQTIAISAKAKVTNEELNRMVAGKSDEEIRQIADEYYGLDNLKDDELTKVKDGKSKEVLSKRAKIGFTTTGHTGGDVGLYVYAPSHLEELGGVVDNTEIARYIERAMNVDLEKTQDYLFKNLKTELEKIGATFNVVEGKTTATKELPTAIVEKNGHVMEIGAYQNKVTINGEEIKISTPTTINKTEFFGNAEIVEKFEKISSTEIEKPEGTVDPSEINYIQKDGFTATQGQVEIIKANGREYYTLKDIEKTYVYDGDKILFKQAGELKDLINVDGKAVALVGTKKVDKFYMGSSIKNQKALEIGLMKDAPIIDVNQFRAKQNGNNIDVLKYGENVFRVNGNDKNGTLKGMFVIENDAYIVVNNKRAGVIVVKNDNGNLQIIANMK